jgi:hypothetical protein
MWFLIPREEHRRRAFSNRMLAKPFVPQKNEESGIIRSFITYTEHHITLC